MPSQQFPINMLIGQLSNLGVSHSFVRQVLPEHWEDSDSDSPLGYRRACSVIARSLGLEYESLLADDPAPKFAPSTFALYKKQTNRTEKDVEISARAAYAAAKLVASALPGEYTPIEKSGKILRESILVERPFVDFDSLLEVCWNAGIPVLVVPTLPGKKMEALAVKVDGRPVIVVSKAEKFRSRLAFWIAHEMGHIALGHLDRFAIIPDAKVSRDALEELEVDANSYALELLFGKANPEFTSDTVRYPSNLASAALAKGRAIKVDPAAIINNWCYLRHKTLKEQGKSNAVAAAVFGLATAALRLLPDQEDGLDLIRARLRKFINVEDLSRDSLSLLKRLTETDFAA